MNQPDSLDPVLKSAIAHLWFVTIHPFDDGNGRIARNRGLDSGTLGEKLAAILQHVRADPS